MMDSLPGRDERARIKALTLADAQVAGLGDEAVLRTAEKYRAFLMGETEKPALITDGE